MFFVGGAARIGREVLQTVRGQTDEGVEDDGSLMLLLLLLLLLLMDYLQKAENLMLPDPDTVVWDTPNIR